MADVVVEVEGLVKVFNGRHRALDGLSLAVESGAIYGLLGPNGAGKTTLIRVLATLLPPDLGTARVAGIDVGDDPRGVRARIGLAGQAAAVDEYLTGRENVEMIGRLYGLPRGQARQRTQDVLERIDLVDVADRQVRTYSGGMRRRLDLAASLAGRPQVLLLDEPTAGLDPVSRTGLWELIRDLVASGTTVLLTSQYLEEADQLADRIAVMDRGRLVSEGSSDQLKDRVGGSVLELRVPPGDRARLLQVLQDAGAEHAAGEQHAATATIAAPDGPRTLTEVLRRLDAAGIEPQEVALRRPTLDEVFIALTGHRTSAPRQHDAARADDPDPDRHRRVAR